MKKLKTPLLLVILFAAGIGEDARGQDLRNPDPVAAQTSSEGSMSGVNLQRSGVSKTKGLHRVSGVYWKSEVLCKPSELTVAAPPIIAGNFVYVRCLFSTSRSTGVGGSFFYSEDVIHALDIQTGRQTWKFQTKQSRLSSLAVAGGLLYFGSDTESIRGNGGIFFALDATTGQEKWRYAVMDSRISTASPAVANDVVYFRDMEGGLYALDAKTGKQLWTFKSKGELTAAAILDDKVYVGSSKRFVYALDAKTGKQHWEYKLDGPAGDPVISDSSIYFHGEDGNIYALDAVTGKQVLKVKPRRKLGSFFVITDKTIYYGGEHENFYAMDVSTGAERWRFKTRLPCRASVVADGTAYVSCYSGELYAINIKTGQQEWKIESKPFHAFSPAVFDGTIYFSRDDGRVYAVR